MLFLIIACGDPKNKEYFQMARFVGISDGYELRWVNVDHVVLVHGHPCGFTVHLTNGDKVEIEAETHAGSYSWNDANDLLTKITGLIKTSAECHGEPVEVAETYPSDDDPRMPKVDSFEKAEQLLYQVFSRLEGLEQSAIPGVEARVDSLVKKVRKRKKSIEGVRD